MKTFPALVTAEYAKSAIFKGHLFKLEAASTYRFTSTDRKVYFDGNYWNPIKLTFGPFNIEMSGAIPSFPIKAPDINKFWSGLHLSENLRYKNFTIYEVLLDANLKVIGYATEAALADPSTGSCIFKGHVDAPRNLNPKNATFDVVSHRISERGEGPRGNYSPTCPWTFKHTGHKVLGTNGSTYTCRANHIGHAATKPITGANYTDVWTLAGAGGAAYVVGSYYQAGTCRYAGAETWCDGSIARCKALGNEINFGGEEYISDLQNKKVIWMGREKTWAGKK